MRFTTATVALLAGLVAAVPQAQSSAPAVDPITQISDGQIQAPPATSGPAVPSAPVSAPGVPAVSTPAVPVVPSGTATPPAPVAPSAPLPGVNGTTAIVVPSGTGASTGSPSGSKTSSGVVQQSSAGAAENAVSFGGVAFAAVLAMLA